MESVTRAKTENRRLAITILILTFSRLIVNMMRRFSYPFAPAIGRALGVPLENVQTVISIQSGIGATSPAFSPLAERYGRKRVMVGALLLMMAANIVGALMPVYGVYLLVMIGFGAGKTIFDPAMQAYIGDRVPYHRRGLAIGTTELSWAGALMVVTPVVAFLLFNFGMRGVFMSLALATGIAAVLIFLTIPDDHGGHSAGGKMVSPVEALKVLSRNPAALAVVAYILIIGLANETFFINFGVWMETTFKATPETLTLTASVIALAEICGEFSIIGLADRFGKKRMAVFGSALAGLTYFVLLQVPSLPVALGLLFVMFFALEVAIVAGITIATEVLPDARAVMMSSMGGSASFGRLLGGAVGGVLFAATGSFPLIGIVAMVLGLTAAFLMLRFVRE